jgi:hypothetical protein
MLARGDAIAKSPRHRCAEPTKARAGLSWTPRKC